MGGAQAWSGSSPRTGSQETQKELNNSRGVQWKEQQDSAARKASRKRPKPKEHGAYEGAERELEGLQWEPQLLGHYTSGQALSPGLILTLCLQGNGTSPYSTTTGSPNSPGL